ncbi:PP2C family protein-serine/threonine phosphatase [Populibacterium corticicola]|jgi:protein phosphatase|uniref:PP2C family protein-serine/threonine phosphatase n=1 Tax=Populibacterium corticicola TaxID=1812826 RepID=A0ABW5XFT5_9MICO
MDQAWGAATHSGRKRKINEDSYLASSPVFVVADGMGGHERGDLASAIAVNEFSKLCQYSVISPELIDGCFTRASGAIKNVLTNGVGGTTVCGVALALQDGAPYWLVFNIGDSRAYRLNTVRGTMTQVSVDHSVVQELVDAGVVDPGEVSHHKDRHVITRALETVTDPEPDYWMIPIEGGDQILLCSDGLCDELEDSEIKEIWSAASTPQAAADALVAAAVEAGGRDNVTVVVVSAQVVGVAASHIQDKTGTVTTVDEEPMNAELQDSLAHTTPRHVRD